MYDLGPMDYELIARDIFLLPPHYFDNLTGTCVFSVHNRQTFLNFLSTRVRDFFIDPHDAHTTLATNCLKLLHLVTNWENKAWRYAVIYWCDHLCRASPSEELLTVLGPPYSARIKQANRVLEWLNVRSSSVIELHSPHEWYLS